jgi:beta-glucosidase/6-phospho-beta-glucosidase/beta-galactosidase
VARSGRSVDFWNRYEEDFDRAEMMGLTGFRLGVDWTRIQPEAPPSEFQEAAVDRYVDMICALRARNLEPLITLCHFTTPQWLGADPWLDENTPHVFSAFERKLWEVINRKLTARGVAPPTWFITINEPNMLVLNTYLNRLFPGGPQAGMATGIRAYNRLLAGHVRAYNTIHDIYEKQGWGTPRVSMNTFCSDVYWSENLLLDLLNLKNTNVAFSDAGEYFRARANELSRFFTNAALSRRTDIAAMAGAGLHKLANFFASRAAKSDGFAFLFEELKRAKRDRCLDFLGLDYYDPFASHALRMPDFSDLEFKSWSISAHMLDVLACKWWDWHFLPEGMTAFCQYYASAFPGMSILIAENGMALRSRIDDSGGEPRRDKITRSAYLEAHLLEVRRMLDADVPVVGYLHWSLTDNYEWGSFSPRFGLYRIDFQRDLARLEVDHLGDRPSQTYARLVREMGLNSLTVNLP